jgi:hypothetical protein
MEQQKMPVCFGGDEGISFIHMKYLKNLVQFKEGNITDFQRGS